MSMGGARQDVHLHDLPAMYKRTVLLITNDLAPGVSWSWARAYGITSQQEPQSACNYHIARLGTTACGAPSVHANHWVHRTSSPALH